MTTEREYKEWREKIRKVRGQKPISKSVHKSVKSYNSGLIIMIFLLLMGGLFALRLNTNNQENIPNQKPGNFEYLNPRKT